MKGLLKINELYPELMAIENSIREDRQPVLVSGVSGSQKTHLMYSLAKRLNKKLFVITATDTLARGVLRKLVLSAYQGNRYINLISTYNTKYGYTSSDAGYVTVANWSQNEAFKIFCQTLVLELRKYITDINTKYNNGDVYTFCPEADSRCVLLTEFAAEMDVALGSVYHKEMVEGLGEYMTINYWQNPSAELLPQIHAAGANPATSPASVHDQIKEITTPASGETPAVVTTIQGCVGVIYDKYAAFICNKLEKTTSDYIPKGDFVSYFHHVVKSYQIDPRNTAVALILA